MRRDLSPAIPGSLAAAELSCDQGLVRDVRAVCASGTAFESRSADIMLRSLTGVPADGHGLTEREREVTWLVAQGLSNGSSGSSCSSVSPP